VLLSLGCGNPFSQFYTGASVSDLQKKDWAVEPVKGDPTVVNVPMSGLAQTVRQYVEDGWIDVGYSSWVGPSGSESEAIEQARKVGASLVVWAYAYRTTTTSSVPITTPTMSTTYGGGTVYGNTGTANWSGTATTYGTQTTVVNVPRHVYSGEAAFLTKVNAPPVFGIYYRRLTGEEQSASGVVDGLAIDVVVRDSPAAKAGLLPGDVVTQLDGTTITSDSARNGEALKNAEGRSVEVAFVRRGQPMTRTVHLNRHWTRTGSAPSVAIDEASDSSPNTSAPYLSRAPAGSSPQLSATVPQPASSAESASSTTPSTGSQGDSCDCASPFRSRAPNNGSSGLPN
jgi:hypothetical protein